MTYFSSRWAIKFHVTHSHHSELINKFNTAYWQFLCCKSIPNSWCSAEVCLGLKRDWLAWVSQDALITPHTYHMESFDQASQVYHRVVFYHPHAKTVGKHRTYKTSLCLTGCVCPPLSMVRWLISLIGHTVLIWFSDTKR